MTRTIKHIVTLTIKADTQEELYELEDSACFEVEKLKQEFKWWDGVDCEIEQVENP
jgi:hypothetical protein